MDPGITEVNQMNTTNVDGNLSDEQFGMLLSTVSGMTVDSSSRFVATSDQSANNLAKLNNKQRDLGIVDLDGSVRAYFMMFHEANPHCLVSKRISESKTPVKQLIDILKNDKLTALTVTQGNEQVNLSHAKDLRIKKTGHWARMIKHADNQAVTVPTRAIDEFIRMFKFGTAVSPYKLRTAASRTLSLFYEKEGRSYKRNVVVPIPVCLSIGMCECCVSETVSYSLSDMLKLFEAYDEGTFNKTEFKERQDSSVHFQTHAEVIATDAKYGIGTMAAALESLQNNKLSVLMPIMYLKNVNGKIKVRFDRVCMRCYKVFLGKGGVSHLLNTLKLNKLQNEVLQSVSLNHSEIRNTWKKWSHKGGKTLDVIERLNIRDTVLGKPNSEETPTNIPGVWSRKDGSYRAVTAKDTHEKLEGIISDFGAKGPVFLVRKGNKLFGKRKFHLKSSKGRYSLVGIQMKEVEERIKAIKLDSISEEFEI